MKNKKTIQRMRSKGEISRMQHFWFSAGDNIVLTVRSNSVTNAKTRLISMGYHNLKQFHEAVS